MSREELEVEFASDDPERILHALIAAFYTEAVWAMAPQIVRFLFRSGNRIMPSGASGFSPRRPAEAPESCRRPGGENQSQRVLPPGTVFQFQVRKIPVSEWPNEVRVDPHQHQHRHQRNEYRDPTGRKALENQHSQALLIAGWTLSISRYGSGHNPPASRLSAFLWPSKLQWVLNGGLRQSALPSFAVFLRELGG